MRFLRAPRKKAATPTTTEISTPASVTHQAVTGATLISVGIATISRAGWLMIAIARRGTVLDCTNSHADRTLRRTVIERDTI